MKRGRFKIGLIGVGGFGLFLLKAYEEMKNIEVACICSRTKGKLEKIARDYKIPKIFTDYKEMLKENLDIVIIATPPFLHYQMVLDALKANKNVLVEKPLALNLKQAYEIKKNLEKKKLKLGIDYVLRENPIVEILKKIMNERIFGAPQIISFQNFASTTNLPPNHWFWDKKKSGGIWIEHGVHFFDLFSLLLNKNLEKAISSSVKRNKEIEDEVACISTYDGILTTFIHSFSKIRINEKTSFQISFDKGNIEVKGWIPNTLEGEGLVNEEEYRKLKEVGLKIKTENLKNKIWKGRTKNYKVNKKVYFIFQDKRKKEEIYKESIKKILDKLCWAIENNKKMIPGIDEAVQSLEAAIKVEKANYFRILN